MTPTRVVVASQNPVKIEAVRIGFAKMFPNEVFDFQGMSVPSGVSSQPIGEKETLTGAKNRVKNISHIISDYWVGIEGGSKHVGQGMETFAWVVIKSKNKYLSKGRTASFFLPKKVVELINQGKELGEADDIVFGRTNSKQSNGAVGLLTDDILTRSTYYETAVILALIPFKNPSLY